MTFITQLSIGINIIILALVIYLFFKGKRHLSNYFVKYVIDIRHQQKLSMFRSCPVSKNSIIFLGDSITEGGNWTELLKGNLVLNRGIGGDVVTGLQKRIDEISRHQPSKLFICIGTNDIARGLNTATIISNYKTLIQTIQKDTPTTKIYIQSAFPVGEKVLFYHNNEKVSALNVEISKMCKHYNIPYIDLHKNFIDERAYLKAEFTNDNLHLMGEAYLLWLKIITPYLNN